MTTVNQKSPSNVAALASLLERMESGDVAFRPGMMLDATQIRSTPELQRLLGLVPTDAPPAKPVWADRMSYEVVRAE